ncbi:hypothetical protein NT6N_36170 [Oceaniferula spumae]|uniref:Uncharacterized protein n=1 Tax=Oceaniferula spumae TaxID=2979115 RepID=A0AAT9FRG1_9BACT
MKNLLLPIYLTVALLTSCAVVPPAQSNANAGASNSPSNSPQAKQKPFDHFAERDDLPDLKWQTSKNSDGSLNLYIKVNNATHFLKRVESFDKLNPSSDEYNLYGVPRKATLACDYRKVGSHQEDGNKLYAIIYAHTVQIYDGWIAPGEMDNRDWKLFRSIPF